MSTPSYRNPPGLDPQKDYDQWKREVGMWEIVTDLEKKKRAIALALSLQGKPREVALAIDADKLNVDDGVKVLVQELDKLYEKDKVDKAYQAYSNFESFKKTETMTMAEYIIGFEQCYNKARRHEMTLPDAVLAFKLLDNACMPHTDRQLALTACHDLQFNTMKSALNRIFSSRSQCDSSDAVVCVKQENVYVAEKYPSYDRGRNLRRGGSRFRGSRGIGRGGQRLNPTYDGVVSRCRFCDSKFHWVKNCPDRQQAKGYLTEDVVDDISAETVNITLYISDQTLTHQEIFVAESYNSAIIDTACTKTVCGKRWLDSFMSSLGKQQKNKIVSVASKTSFKFGDGAAVISEKKVKLPAKIGTVSCYIESEVVPCDIPLLLSKDSLKKANTVLDLANDKVSMFEQLVEVHLTSSGHYCISIDGHVDSLQASNNSEESCLVIDAKMSQRQKRNILTKLHKQFGHASSDKLFCLLQSAGEVVSGVKDLLKDVCSKCSVCFKYKKHKPKPAVGFAMANDFNQIVALDLHQLDKNLYYLHVIDLFSRLSAAAIIRSKEPRIIVDQFMKIWVNIYGVPEVGVFTDNGGEFSNSLFMDMAENLNMSVKTTAGYSPWSNGVVERHNATLTETLLKLREDSSLSWEGAISWAISAKNSLLNVHGYSPFQIVFGRNPNLPSAIVNKPPALEGQTVSEVMSKHLTGLYQGRKAFIAAESSERVRRAIRKQVRPTGDKFQSGDKVYFQRDKLWKGPGWVIGQDGVVVFVRYGSTFVRVHESRLMKEIPAMVKDSLNSEASDIQTLDNDSHVLPESDASTHQSSAASADDSYDDSYEIRQQAVDDTCHDGLPDSTPSQVSDAAEDQQEDGVSTATISEDYPADFDCNKLKKNERVQFNIPDDNDRQVVRILGRAGKATTKTRSWYNVEFEEPEYKQGTCISIDLSEVENLHCLKDVSEQSDESVLITDIDFMDAKKAELENWKRQNVYEEIENNGQKCVTTRWVCTLKEDNGEIKRKARLVARGFEEDCLDSLRKDSPTCDKQSLRTVLSIITHKKWKINCLDVKTAFLQGEEIKRKVYIKPPKEAGNKNVVWMLKKCVYGLADASLRWYEMVKKTLMGCGATMSSVDPAIFYWHTDKGLAGVLAVHVDDFFWAGDALFEEKVISKVRRQFNIGKEQTRCFMYLGLELSQSKDVITLSQTKYSTSLKMIQVDRNRDNSSSLTDEEQTVLRSKLGQLLWIANQTRPDISYDVCEVASRLKHSTILDLKALNKIIKRVLSENVTLKFQDPGEDPQLFVFSDASFGNLMDGGSQGGFVIFIVGRDGSISPLAWESKRVRRVVRSTIAAETLSMAEAVDCGVVLGTLIAELLYNQSEKPIPITCIIDNKDLYSALFSTKHVTEKRLRREISSLREMIQRKLVKDVKWVESKNELANVLTKRGATGTDLLKCFERGRIDSMM